jgi:hypothetical protein
MAADPREVSTAPREYASLLAGMRRLLLVAAVLVFLAGVQLYVFTGRTADYFAWTIATPLTAAFLGAAYWGSVVIEAIAARQRRWADARIAVPTVLVFTVLTLVVTLVHLGLFHLGPRFALATRAVTWAWIAIYAVVPVLLAVISVVQWRRGGTDPPRDRPLPRPLAVLIAGQAVVLLVLGATLLVVPLTGARLWPWALTPLTGRAIGAWLFSLGVAAVHSLVERDLGRLRPAAWGYLTIAVLEAVALARYPAPMRWGTAPSVCYLIFLATMVVAGVAALLAGAATGPAS